MPAIPSTAGDSRLRTLRHAGIDAVDQLPESRIETIARVRQIDLDLGGDAAGIGRKHQNAVAHQHRLLDVMRHHQHGLDRQPAFNPEIHEVGAEGLGGQHVKRRKRLIHQQQVRMHDQRPRKADTLAHAARQFLGVRRLETVEADQVDRRERPRPPFGAVDPKRLQTKLDVLKNRQPWEQRERLKHHGNAVRRPLDGLATAFCIARGWRDEAGDDAQQRRLARSGPAEQADDFA